MINERMSLSVFYQYCSFCWKFEFRPPFAQAMLSLASIGVHLQLFLLFNDTLSRGGGNNLKEEGKEEEKIQVYIDERTDRLAQTHQVCDFTFYSRCRHATRSLHSKMCFFPQSNKINFVSSSFSDRWWHFCPLEGSTHTHSLCHLE